MDPSLADPCQTVPLVPLTIIDAGSKKRTNAFAGKLLIAQIKKTTINRKMVLPFIKLLKSVKGNARINFAVDIIL